MRAKRIDRPNYPAADLQPAGLRVGASGGTVTNGGVVADWQREIQVRFSGYPDIDRETPGEMLMRRASRSLGWGALLSGYVGIGYAALSRLV